MDQQIRRRQVELPAERVRRACAGRRSGAPPAQPLPAELEVSSAAAPALAADSPAPRRSMSTPSVRTPRRAAPPDALARRPPAPAGSAGRSARAARRAAGPPRRSRARRAGRRRSSRKLPGCGSACSSRRAPGRRTGTAQQHARPGRARSWRPVADDLGQRGAVHPLGDQHLVGLATTTAGRDVRVAGERLGERPLRRPPPAGSRAPRRPGPCSSASSGLTSRPGISTPNSRPAGPSWLKSLSSACPAPGYWILTATVAPVVPDRPVHLADRGRRGRLVVELAGTRAPVRAQLLGQHRCTVAAGSGGADSCSLVSAARYGAGDLLGQRRLEDRQRLAELHRAALELAEHLEELLGGALLDLGGDDLGGCAADPLAEARASPGRRPRAAAPRAWRSGSPPSGAHVRRRAPPACQAGNRPAGSRGRPRGASGTAGPGRPRGRRRHRCRCAGTPHSGCTVHVRPPQPPVRAGPASNVPPAVAGSGMSAMPSRNCKRLQAGCGRDQRPGAAAGRAPAARPRRRARAPTARSGQRGSRSARCRCTHVRHPASVPAPTSGPTTPVSSCTPGPSGAPPPCHASSSASIAFGGVRIERLTRGDHDQGKPRLIPLRAPGAAGRRVPRAAPAVRPRWHAARPTACSGSPQGATSPGCTAPPSRTSTRPTPEPESTAAIAAPTRPAPRTWTRMALRAASLRAASPGSGCTEKGKPDPAVVAPAPRAGPVTPPPPRRRPSDRPPPRPPSAARAARRPAPVAGPGRGPARRGAAGPGVPSSSSRKWPVAGSTGEITTACAGGDPELHGVPVPPGPAQRRLQHRMHGPAPIVVSLDTKSLNGRVPVRRVPVHTRGGAGAAAVRSWAVVPPETTMPVRAERREELSTGRGY